MLRLKTNRKQGFVSEWRQIDRGKMLRLKMNMKLCFSSKDR